MEVGFGDFGEAVGGVERRTGMGVGNGGVGLDCLLDAEDPGVELEAGDAEVVGYHELVEAAPEARHGFEG